MRKPNAAPSRKPTAASFAVKRAASRSTSIRSGPFRRDGSKRVETMSCTCGSVRSFTSNVPSRNSVVSPNHLKASQKAQSARRTARKRPACAAAARTRSLLSAGGRPAVTVAAATPLLTTSLDSAPMPLDPSRTVAELRELRELTGDENGAQRVAWTPTWVQAKDWLGSKLDGLPLEYEVDQAGNQWWTLRGESERAVLLGGHIDSVPNGGWLDGCLNVVAAVEVLRRIAEEGTPPVTVRLVNWADEEGARFGRSLFGSSAAAGSMADQDELRELSDRDGVALPDALREHGVELDSALEARAQLESAAAYLELHIEQGPVLESMDLPLGAVLGTFGVERHRITWRGQAAHAGSTPMNQRRDALAGAAKLALELREIAARVGDGAVLTSGGVVCKPGIVTSVVETAEQLLDMRHLDAGEARLDVGAGARGLRALRGGGEARGRVRAHLADRADPLRRDADRLRRRGDPRGGRRVAPPSERAAARRRRGLARGVPTVMLFVQSLRGLSHTKLEDTKPEHLELAVQALDRLRRRRSPGSRRRLERAHETPGTAETPRGAIPSRRPGVTGSLGRSRRPAAKWSTADARPLPGRRG